MKYEPTLNIFPGYGFFRAKIGTTQIGSISDRVTLKQLEEWKNEMQAKAKRLQEENNK